MTPQDILETYNRAVQTQQRRLILRSLLALSLIVIATLNVLDIGISKEIHIVVYVVLFTYLIYSYGIGRRKGAAKEFRAIAKHYMAQDTQLQKLMESEKNE